MSSHETFKDHGEVKTASEKSFGYLFAIVFSLVGLFPLLSGGEVRLWSLAVAAFFFVFSTVAPQTLKPLNWVWMKIGFVLHLVVTPLVMGSVFVLTVIPTGIIRRLAGKDSMDIKWDKEAKTYWIKRKEGEPAPESMKNQF